MVQTQGRGWVWGAGYSSGKKAVRSQSEEAELREGRQLTQESGGQRGATKIGDAAWKDWGVPRTQSLAASCGLGKITVYINAYMIGRLKGRERELQTTLEREGLTKPAESRGCKRSAGASQNFVALGSPVWGMSSFRKLK